MCYYYYCTLVMFPWLNNTQLCFLQSGLLCSCSAVILAMDPSVTGYILCEVNTPTLGMLSVTTIKVAPNRNFNIQLVAANSKASMLKPLEISELIFRKCLVLWSLPYQMPKLGMSST